MEILEGVFACDQRRRAPSIRCCALWKSTRQQRSRLSVLRPDDHAVLRLDASRRAGVRALSGACPPPPREAMPCGGRSSSIPRPLKPYLFHLARLTVVRKADPEIAELAQEETVECRLVGVCQSEGAEITRLPRGASALAARRPRAAARSPTASRGRQEAVELRSGLPGRAGRPHHGGRTPVAAARTLAERETFVQRGFDFQEAELATARDEARAEGPRGQHGGCR